MNFVNGAYENGNLKDGKDQKTSISKQYQSIDESRDSPYIPRADEIVKNYNRRFGAIAAIVNIFPTLVSCIRKYWEYR